MITWMFVCQFDLPAAQLSDTECLPGFAETNLKVDINFLNIPFYKYSQTFWHWSLLSAECQAVSSKGYQSV